MLKSYLISKHNEAGCDEAGRGCLAGPVYAAAVIFPESYENELLNDSKKLTKQQREMLRIQVQKEAKAWAIGIVHNEEIDKINILNASILAMHKAIQQLNIIPECLIIDGNKFKPFKNIPHQCIVKGDGKYLSIAAASILAKTYRDDYMTNLHSNLPFYAWNKNMGYPTSEHRYFIKKFGVSLHHRKSFNLYGSPLQLKLL